MRIHHGIATSERTLDRTQPDTAPPLTTATATTTAAAAASRHSAATSQRPAYPERRPLPRRPDLDAQANDLLRYLFREADDASLPSTGADWCLHTGRRVISVRGGSGDFGRLRRWLATQHADATPLRIRRVFALGFSDEQANESVRQAPESHRLLFCGMPVGAWLPALEPGAPHLARTWLFPTPHAAAQHASPGRRSTALIAIARVAVGRVANAPPTASEITPLPSRCDSVRDPTIGAYRVRHAHQIDCQYLLEITPSAHTVRRAASAAA